VYIPAGLYLVGVLPVWSGGSGSLIFRGGPGVGPSPFGTVLSSFAGPLIASVASGDLNDPPTTTGIAAYTGPVTHPGFAFRST
jgi:hypothetical protein